MQYSVRFLAALSAAFLIQTSRSEAPLYVEAFSFTNRMIELKDFNHSGDLLVTLLVVNPTGNGEDRQSPAIIRAGRAIDLYPVGTPSISSVYVEAISQVRDDGSVYVAGTGIMKDGFWRASLWNVAADGSFTFRTMPNIILPEDSSAPGEQPKSYGFAVNKAGSLVGAGDSYLASLATIWTPPYANAVRYLLSTGSAFTEINEAGLLIANGVEFDHGNSNNRYAAAVTYAGGVPTEIPLLEMPPATLWPNNARSMNGEWVAGEAHLRSGTTRGFAWKIGSASAINLPNPAEVPFEEGSYMQATSINTSGHAVGYFNGGNHSTRPILWHYDGQKHNALFLSSRIVGTRYPEYRAEYDIEINDQHQVAFVARELNQSILRVFQPLTNGLVEFLQESVWVDEESGKAEFSLKLHRPPGNTAAMTVNFETIDGTAKAGIDYVARTGSVTWQPGEPAEKVVAVQLINDTTIDPERSFTFRLIGGTKADLSPAREIPCSIVDSFQQFAPRNQMSVGWMYGTAVLHGQPQAIVKFERFGGSDGAITFTNFQTFGFGAERGVDYELPAALRLTWAPGETNVKTLTIPLLNTNTPINETKSFNLFADAIFDGTEVGASLSANVIIVRSRAEAPPVVDTSFVNKLLESLSMTISAVQGSMLELEKSIDGLSSWSTAAEGRSEDGEVRFTAPVNSSEKSGFYRIKVKE